MIEVVLNLPIGLWTALEMSIEVPAGNWPEFDAAMARVLPMISNMTAQLMAFVRFAPKREWIDRVPMLNG
ncbi:MAG: hypothetical protein R3C05_09300 [Pirellulaceae bacterium]